MKERVKQLAEQAGMTDDKFGMFFAKDKHNEDGVDLEKFVELIVRECMELTRWKEYDMSTEQRIRHSVYRDIKEHFEIKEPSGWVCPKCGTDRTKAACSLGHSAAVDGRCPMVGTARRV